MARIIWGIILIGLGVLFFGRNLGWTNVDIGQFLSQYWPLILIIIGLLVLADVFKSVILRALIVVILIVLFSLPFIFADSLNFKKSVSAQTQAINLNSAQKLNLDLAAGAVTLDINDQVSSQEAVKAQLKSEFLTLEKTEKRQGNQLDVALSLSNKKNWNFNFKNIKNRLVLSLNPKLSHDLELNLGASTVNADLTKLNIENLDLGTGATTVNLTLGDLAKNSEINIKGGAATINLDIPANAGAQVTFEGALSKKDLEGFNQITDNLYQTENYGSAKKKIIIRANLGAASFNLNRY